MTWGFGGKDVRGWDGGEKKTKTGLPARSGRLKSAGSVGLLQAAETLTRTFVFNY